MKSSMTPQQVTKLGVTAIKTLVLVLLAFICILIGALLQRGLSGENSLSSGNNRGAFTQSDIFPNISNQDILPITSFSAVVISKEADSMKIRLNSGKEIQVGLAPDLVVVSQSPKDQSVFEAEQEIFLQSLSQVDNSSENTQLPESPSPFVESVISLDSVEIGASVFLESEQDILSEKQVTIKKIVLLETPEINIDLDVINPEEAE
jgi:hypothetical protein